MSQYGGTGFDDFAEVELPRLWRLGYTLTRNADDASDLAQETLVRVGLRWAHVDRGWNPSAYARSTLVRLHINHSRRASLEAVWRTSRPPRPFAEPFERVEIADQIDALLTHLPPRQRAAVVLRYLEDLSIAEIAAALDCSQGTIKSQLAKARRSARTYLGINGMIEAE